MCASRLLVCHLIGIFLCCKHVHLYIVHLQTAIIYIQLNFYNPAMRQGTNLISNTEDWLFLVIVQLHLYNLFEFFPSNLRLWILWRSLLRWSCIFQRPYPNMTAEYMP